MCGAMRSLCQSLRASLGRTKLPVLPATGGGHEPHPLPRILPVTAPQASELLASAAQGFERSHGKDLARLRALKGDNCAEFALYARLHLLQGVVALLQGGLSKALAALTWQRRSNEVLCVQWLGVMAPPIWCKRSWSRC
jgi:hypothetical protein